MGVGTKKIKSSYNNKVYKVQEDQMYQQKAADVMARIDTDISRLINYLNKKYQYSQDKDKKSMIKNITKRYNKDNIFEISPVNRLNDTSYVINKTKMALCLREKDPTKTGDPNAYDIHDHNVLMFVALHELSHMAIPDIQHTEKFWDAFHFILYEASKGDIYHSPNYQENPVDYCGLKVDYSPLWDAKYMMQN